MNSIIIDDDSFFCKIMQEYCKKCEIEVLHTFTNSINAYKFLQKKQKIDVIFLDVHMPDLNGFDILKDSSDTKVIMTTTDSSKAVEAFEYNVVDFLLKPVTFQRFVKAISRIEGKDDLLNNSEEPKEQAHLFVNINKRLVKLIIHEIDYIEAQGNYILIKMQDGKELMVHTTLKKISDKLVQGNFFKVHRSFIINSNKIVDIEDSSIVIGKKVIPLSKTHRNNLFEKLNLLE